MKFAIAVLVIAMTFTARAAPYSHTSDHLPNQLLLADQSVELFSRFPNKDDFIFDFNQPHANTGKGGEMLVANHATFPALAGTNSGMAIGRLGACGINPPHLHPRASELQVVIQGKIITEMLPENGVLDVDGKQRLIRSELSPFQMTPFFQGYVHTQFNPNCEPAIFVAYFPSLDPGTLQTSDGSLSLGENIERVHHAIPSRTALDVLECLERCGLRALTGLAATEYM